MPRGDAPADAAAPAAAAPPRRGGATAAGGRAVLAAVVHEDLEPVVPLTEDEIETTLAFKIIAQFKTPKDIRISVAGEYWERLPELRGTRLIGTIAQWSKKTAPERRLIVVWEDGRDTEHLDKLLHPRADVRFEPFEDGRPAPRLTGRAAAREHRAEAENLEKEKVEIEYEDGSQRKVQVWTVELPDAITVDQRKEPWVKPKLNRPLTSLNTPYKMWVNAALPIKLVDRMVTLCNQRLSGDGDVDRKYYYRKTTPGEIIRFLSYMGALAVERGEPIENMWRYQKAPRDLRPPPAFGDHGLSKNRFERLRELAGKLWDVSEEQDSYDYDEKDMWRWSDTPFKCFNEHYSEVLAPGSLIGPDETMCPSEHEEGPTPQNIPHSHFIPRKPKESGAELNTIADGQCGGIYRIDIERGKNDLFEREFEAAWGYTTALNFRLAKNELDSNRIYAGDSRFMSVDAIEDLHFKNMYGIGDVKTKTSRYPVKKIMELCGPNAGDWSLMSSELEGGFKIYAIGHRRGGEVHTFIASCGLTIAGVPQKHREDMGVYGSMEARKCPQVLNMWSQMQPKIDKNNRFRQDILGIEERFVTKSFPFRMLTTVIGITFANAFEWFNYFIDSKKYCDETFLAFMRDLSYDGMHNTYDQQAMSPAGRAATADASSPARQLSPRQICMQHRIVPIKSIPGFKGSPKQLCAVCQDNKHKTRTCCFLCSTAERVFGLHPESVTYSKKTITYNCLQEHHADPSDELHKKHCAIPTGRKRRGNKKRTREMEEEDDDG